MFSDLFIYIVIGFSAQLVDSALGMAFGSLSSSMLLAIGFPVHSISATVHAAEVFGGGAATFSHWRLKNIDWSLLTKLLLPAVLGASFGAFLILRFDDSQSLKPWIGGYFSIVGIIIIVKSIAPKIIKTVKTPPQLLGLLGGFLDAFGGAGWGEFVSSGLLLRNHTVRTAIGSLVCVEFIISAVITAIFFQSSELNYPIVILGLVIGAVIGAPIGAWVCKRAPAKKLTFFVGLFICIAGGRAVYQSF